MRDGFSRNSRPKLGLIAYKAIKSFTGNQPNVASAKPDAQPAAQGSQVDVAAIMDKLAAQSKEKLDWRKSIVDLMKLLNLDSSLGARKHLAEQLHFTRDMNDSASMNVWLHKQVMIKLVENGGKVPNELRSWGIFPEITLFAPCGPFRT